MDSAWKEQAKAAKSEKILLEKAGIFNVSKKIYEFPENKQIE
jgi:hypothetical protein